MAFTKNSYFVDRNNKIKGKKTNKQSLIRSRHWNFQVKYSFDGGWCRITVLVLPRLGIIFAWIIQWIVRRKTGRMVRMGRQIQ